MSQNPFVDQQMMSLASADRSVAGTAATLQDQAMNAIARQKMRQDADAEMTRARLTQDQMKSTEALAQLEMETQKSIQESGQQHAEGMQTTRHMFEEEQSAIDRQHETETTAMREKSNLKAQELIANKEIEMAKNAANAHAAFINGEMKLEEQYKFEMDENNRQRVRAQKNLHDAEFIFNAFGVGGSQYMKVQGQLYEKITEIMDHRRRVRSGIRDGVSTAWISGFTNLSDFANSYLNGDNIEYKISKADMAEWVGLGQGDFDDRDDRTKVLKRGYLRHRAGVQIISGALDSLQLGMMGLSPNEQHKFKTAFKGHLTSLLFAMRLERDGHGKPDIAEAKETAADYLTQMRGVVPDDKDIALILHSLQRMAQSTLGGGKVAKEALGAIGHNAASGVSTGGGDRDPESRKRLREVMHDIIALGDAEDGLGEAFGDNGPNDRVLNQTEARYTDEDEQQMKEWIPQVIAKLRTSVDMNTFRSKISDRIKDDPKLWSAVQAEFARMQLLRMGPEGLGGLQGGGTVDDLVAEPGVMRNRRTQAIFDVDDLDAAQTRIGEGNIGRMRELHNQRAIDEAATTPLDLSDAAAFFDQPDDDVEGLADDGGEFIDYD